MKGRERRGKSVTPSFILNVYVFRDGRPDLFSPISRSTGQFHDLDGVEWVTGFCWTCFFYTVILTSWKDLIENGNPDLSSVETQSDKSRYSPLQSGLLEIQETTRPLNTQIVSLRNLKSLLLFFTSVYYSQSYCSGSQVTLQTYKNPLISSL